MSARATYVLPLLAVFLAIAVHRGEALRCWACTSGTATNCRDPFNKTKITLDDCERMRTAGSQARAYCQKVMESVHNGESRIVRKCVFSHETLDGKCPDSASHAVVKTEYCSTCDTDECNAAPGLALPPAGVALLFPALAWTAVRLMML